MKDDVEYFYTIYYYKDDELYDYEEINFTGEYYFDIDYVDDDMFDGYQIDYDNSSGSSYVSNGDEIYIYYIPI